MTNEPHTVEQAVFTSARTARGQGYQLVAQSPGVARRQARELARWCPTHNSLLDPTPESRSVNCHRLSCATFCVSTTYAAGREYSRRTGPRIYTHCLVLPPETYRQFANNPFAVADALAPPHTRLDGKTPQLEPIEIDAAVQDADLAKAEKLRREGRWQHLVALLDAVLEGPLAGAAGYDDCELLFAATLSLLPLSCRPEISLSTGLVFSQQRPFRLSALPSDLLVQRRLKRQTGMVAVDFSQPLPPAWSPRHGWTAFVMAAGEAETWHVLRDAMTGSDPHLRYRDPERLDPRAQVTVRNCAV